MKTDRKLKDRPIGSIGTDPCFFQALAGYLDAALTLVDVPAREPAAFVRAAEDWDQSRFRLVSVVDAHCARVVALTHQTEPLHQAPRATRHHQEEATL